MHLSSFTSRHRSGRRGFDLLLSLMLLLASTVALSADPRVDRWKPKLGPDAVPIQQSHDYLRTHDAPDYWALSPFYESQITNSACSLATVTALLNSLRGLPPLATDPLVTQSALRDAIAGSWAVKTRDNGEGVTFEEFKAYALLSLKAFELDAEIEVFKPSDTSPTRLAELRQLLADNERSADDIALVYYNQGVVTGDWDGPHLSPIAAYDAERRRVLIMDVDRQWYGPYWTADEKLLEAIVKPAARGNLVGETGGVLRVTVRRTRSTAP